MAAELREARRVRTSRRRKAVEARRGSGTRPIRMAGADDKFAQLFTSSEPEPRKPKVSKSRGKYTERAGRYDELSV